MHRIWKFAAFMLLVVALGVTLAACGSDTSKEDAQANLKADLQAFQSEVSTMAALTASSTVDEWKAARASVQEAWDKVVADAVDVKEAEVTNVQAAWDNLAKAVDDIDADTPLKDVVPQLQEEITALKAAYEDLYNGLK
jgi:hypothetical protein